MLDTLFKAIKALIAHLQAYWSGISDERKKEIMTMVWLQVQAYFVKRYNDYMEKKKQDGSEGATAA